MGSDAGHHRRGAAVVAAVALSPAVLAADSPAHRGHAHEPAAGIEVGALRAHREMTRGGSFALAGTLHNGTGHRARVTPEGVPFARVDERIRVGPAAGWRSAPTPGACSRWRPTCRPAWTVAPTPSAPDVPDGNGGRACGAARRKLIVPGDPDGPTPPPPNPTPGPRTLGDPLFPEVGNGGYDALHYDVALDWTDVGDLFLAGTSLTMTADATQDLADFSLDLEGLTVGAVTVNGAAATFSREAPATCSGTPPCPATKLVIVPADPIDGRGGVHGRGRLHGQPGASHRPGQQRRGLGGHRRRRLRRQRADRRR